MKNRKTYEIILFTIFCIFINLGGRLFAEYLTLPLWLDSFGTVLAAYVCGPFCGVVVGVALDVIKGLTQPVTYIYSITSVAIALIAGFAARKKLFESVFGTLSVGYLAAMTATAVSVTLNCIFCEGYTDNLWGDGIVDMMLQWGLNLVPASIAGQFFLEFPDKVITFAALALFVREWRRHKEFIRRLRAKRRRAATSALALIAVAAICLPSANTSYAEADEVRYNGAVRTVYDSSDGLPGGGVCDIASTKDGIIWVGTYNGLYRYSGKKFEQMRSFDSVKNVNCFFADEEGRLWIGTNDNGVSICINNEITNELSHSDGLPSDSVRCIAERSDGKYYIATSGSLAVATLSGGFSVTNTIDEIKYAISITEVENSYAAAVTDSGELFLLDGDTVVEKAAGDNFTCCAVLKGQLYVGTTGSKIEVYDVSTGKLTKKSDIDCVGLLHINSINVREDTGVVICADNGAGYIMPSGTYIKVNTGEFCNSIDHMIFDYQGNLWLSSSRLGLMKLRMSMFSDIYGDAGISPDVVNCVTKWNGNMYFGGDNGLTAANADATATVSSDLSARLAGTRVRCLMTDSKNRLWVCTSGSGAWTVTPDGGVTVHYGTGEYSRVRTALELEDGAIALGGNSGVAVIKDGEPDTLIGAAEGMANPKVLCLCQSAGGALLAGTDGNGIEVMENGKITGHYSEEDGLSSEIILRLVRDGDEGIFIVTGNGLCYMESNGEIRELTTFPYYNNYDVTVCDDGTLFVLSSAGIYVVGRNELLSGNTLSYTLLNEKNGLDASLTPNSWSYTDEDDNLYVPCDTGVMRFNLNSYSVPDKGYRMQLHSVTIDGEISYITETGHRIIIPKGSDRVEFAPEIVDYSESDPYVRIYLEGYDSGAATMPLGELSNIVYTNLPAGSYTLHISVLNHSNAPLAEVSYPIVREKEIYNYWWFRVYAMLVGALSVVYMTWMLFRTQVRRVAEMRKRELELVKRQADMSNETIFTIARTVDAKDPRTGRHSARVATYSVLIARRLGFSDEELENLRKAALLHDIGKIAIPDSILTKPARLTDEEFEIMKSHVVKGAQILKNFTAVENVADGALYHHERYDGKGYVSGLKGEEIPYNARIIGIADAFDAMTKNRIYRQRLDMEFVVNELKKGRGTQFDPHITDILLELIREGAVRPEKFGGNDD